MSENIKVNPWEAAEEIVNLRRENAALRRDVYQCPPTSENDYEGFKWRDACEELERENAALRGLLEECSKMLTDSKLLDYRYVESGDMITDFYAMAERIDEARKEAQP